MIDLWNLKSWYDFLLRGVFLAGFFALFLIVGMQIWGWEVTIGIPRIESSFVKKSR